MPLTVSRPVTVYRLWLAADRTECFEDHAARGWLCSLVCHNADGPVVWVVRMQLNGTNALVVAATLDDVIISDGSTTESQTLADYNAANPGDQIESGS